MEKTNISALQFQKLLDTPPSINKKGKTHSYKHKKTPRIHACIGALPIKKNSESKKKLGKANIILQKGPKSHLEQLNCSANQNYPLFFIEKAEELLLKKVENYKVKERLIALQNFRRLAYEMQKCISAKIHQEVKMSQKEKVDFYDLLDKREERHFRMDRIIRYLAEP